MVAHQCADSFEHVHSSSMSPEYACNSLMEVVAVLQSMKSMFCMHGALHKSYNCVRIKTWNPFSPESSFSIGSSLYVFSIRMQSNLKTALHSCSAKERAKHNRVREMVERNSVRNLFPLHATF